MQHIHEETFSRHLPVKFTEDQIRQKAEEMANKYTKATRLENEKKSAMAGYKSRIDVVLAEIALLAKHVSEKCEYQNVECRAVWDWPVYGEKSIYRNDTGEFVGTEAMEHDDRQLKLKLKRDTVAHNANPLATPEPAEAPAEPTAPETTSGEEPTPQEAAGEEEQPEQPKTLLEELDAK